MWVYENLELCIGGVFAAGIAGHFFRRWRHRQRYRALRRAFEEAVRQVQATDGDAAAVVRCAELERDFMRAWWLPYSLGLGRRAWRMLKLCALLTFLAFICLGGIAARERGRGSTRSRRENAGPALVPMKAEDARLTSVSERKVRRVKSEPGSSGGRRCSQTRAPTAGAAIDGGAVPRVGGAAAPAGIRLLSMAKRIVQSMATIFISHSSHDDGFVDQLSSDLTLLGHRPWTDDLRIHPGDKIISSIQDGLAQSRYCMVVLSQAAVHSRWVDTEWKEKFWESATNQKIRIIPLLREASEMPLFLRGLRYADFTRSYAVGFAHLALALSSAESRMPNVLDRSFLHAIEDTAQKHPEDHIRLACAHTVWSFRPDRAKPILEDALHDLRDIVRVHAKLLLDEFY